jgi:aminoacyl tRNA synthase complex-interacting multifunctional protein 1
MTSVDSKSPIDLIEAAIAQLEAQLNLQPGQTPVWAQSSKPQARKENTKTPAKKEKAPAKQVKQADTSSETDLPDICKLEFKVGIITKVWVHPEADKLYCEEIDVGEGEPRQIASGLRLHFTEAQMLGQRLLVASNLKAKNLVGFKSHGMVLCAKQMRDGNELVEFVEPPERALVGEVVTFEGLPPPQPYSPAQVDKKKVWLAAVEGLKTTADKKAAWNGHVFMTLAGPCTVKTIAEGPMS